MGNTCEQLCKLRDYIHGQEPWLQSYFYKQETIEYSDILTKKCINHLVDTGSSSFESLKKAHRYLCPAIKYYQKIVKRAPISKSETSQIMHEQNIDQIDLPFHERQLKISAKYILTLYFNFLAKVVPANISYFHFIREKDFYIHYIAIKYSLKFGFMQLRNRKSNLFDFIPTETKVEIYDYFSHWTYDMVQYKCSFIYLQSHTLSYLIENLAVLLCSLLADDKLAIMENFEESKVYQIYNRTLWIFLYLLCRCNKEKSYSDLQVIVGGINKVIKQLYGDGMHQQKKTPYAVSSWYAEQIGFISQPYLQKVIFLLITHILRTREEQSPKKKQKSAKKEPSKSRTKQKKRKIHKLQTNQNYQTQYDLKVQQRIAEQEEGQKIQQIIDEESNQDGQDKQKCQFHEESFVKIQSIKEMTTLTLYQTLYNILKIFPYLRELPEIIDLLMWETSKKIDKQQVFLKPFFIKIINALNKNQSMLLSGLYSQRQNLHDLDQHLTNKKQRSNSPTLKPNSSKLKIPVHLKHYLHDNQQILYEVDSTQIPCEIVSKNCEIFIEQNYIETVKQYILWEKQWERNQGSIWKELLKYNTHEFIKMEEK